LGGASYATWVELIQETQESHVQTTDLSRMKKRAPNGATPKYRLRQSDSVGDVEAMLNDLVDVVISGYCSCPAENTGDSPSHEKTPVKRDSFHAGLPLANPPYSGRTDQ
jgi:hypothetical protein